MPLFMTIVGYFSNSLLKLSLREVVIKKGRQLLLPALSSGIILLFIECYSGGVKSGIKLYLYSFWFLKSAFLCCILFYFANKYFKHKIVGIIFTLLLSQIIGIFQLYIMYPCFIFGTFINQNIDKIKAQSKILIFFFGTIFILFLLFWDASFWDIPQKIIIIKSLPDTTAAYSYIYKISYRIIIGFVGTIFFISLFEYLSNHIAFPQQLKYICKFGKDTLGIYLLQTFILEIILQHFIKFDGYDFCIFNFIIAPIISIFILFICLWVISLIEKSTLMSLIILGKKRQ